MFVVPVISETGLKNLPYATICIILLNCLILFFFQSTDDTRINHAWSYYYDSGLAQIEVPRYAAWLDGKIQRENVYHLDNQSLIFFHNLMLADKHFLMQLAAEKIIQKTDTVYKEWKSLRKAYENKLSAVVSFHYGLAPAAPRLSSFFTYMFLHSSAGHLLSNMLFLWLAGCILETGTGRLKYITCYILSGLSSAILFCLIYHETTTPLVGASGAVSGLMGMFAVLFAKKKVRILYSLGFYFNYIKIHAAILLPVWVGIELCQIFMTGQGSVAYMTHITGIISGSVFALACIKFSGNKFSGNEEKTILKTDDINDTRQLIQAALHHMSRLELDKGRNLFEQVLLKNPDHIWALIHLFNILKLEPKNIAFHKTSRKLMDLLSENPNTYEKAFTIYEEYISLVKKPLIVSDSLLRYARIFMEIGQLRSASKILSGLLKSNPEAEGMSEAVMKLALEFRKKEIEKGWDKCCKIIIFKYPNSKEAKILQVELKNIMEPEI